MEIIYPFQTPEDRPIAYAANSTGASELRGNERETANNAMMKLTMPAKGLNLPEGSIIRRAAAE